MGKSAWHFFIVGTPIGHLGDLSFRAVETLKTVDLIAAEDTRATKVLLDRYGITTPMTSCFEQNERRKTPELIRLMKEGTRLALVSESGMPSINDPGFVLIREAIREEIPFTAIPGPTAFVTALVLSGLPTDRFAFDGYLPRTSAKRRKLFASLQHEDRTLMFYESPHRILQALEDVVAIFGDLEIAVCRELTKRFEEVLRGSAGDVWGRLRAIPPKGEYVLVVSPPGRQAKRAD